jgi:hypothetical protein
MALKYCQSHKCHTYDTKDRKRGSKDNRTNQTRRRSSFYYGGGNFCSLNCYNDWSEDFMNRAIDNIMTRLRSLVEETGAGLILVSHLRRVDGNKGHENGVEVSLSHLRGSNSIGQLSDCVIALERNQQSDDDLEARTTKLRILKSRYTGDVGMATSLVYDKDSGRLTEYSDAELMSNEEETLMPF